MPEPSVVTSRKPSSYALGLALGLLAGGLAVTLVLLIAGHSQSGPLAALWSSMTGRNTRIVSQGTVVERIQKLQRMETVVYNMDKIVTGEKGSPFLPDFLAGDRMLMIVHGQVVAGIDFAQLRPGDIRIQDRNIQVKIPPPRVLFTRLDNSRTRVYSRSTGLLVPVDPTLESQVRQQAEGELLDEAGRAGILKTAGDNARNTLRTLLLGMGFATVEIE